MGRSPCCDKAAVKRGPWSAEEDARLRSYMERHAGDGGGGGSWIALPRKAGLRRCGKSCRLRWLNYLRPDLRHGGFTPEEDRLICALYAAVGSRWSLIAAHLPGRTDNGVKNHWNTRLKKKLHLFLPGMAMAPPIQRRRDRHHRGRGYQYHHQDPNAAIDDAAAAQQPLPSWSSQAIGGCDSGGVGDHMDFFGGAAAAGEADMIAAATISKQDDAAAAGPMSQQQPTDASYHPYEEPALLTELDEIFRSIISASGGEHSDDLSQSRSTTSTDDVDAATNWNLYQQQGESVLQNHHLGLPHLYW